MTKSTSLQNLDAHPILKTSRLLMRELRKSDLPGIFNLRTDKQVNEYLDRLPVTTQKAVAGTISALISGWEKREWLYWVIEKEGQMIGTICLWNFEQEGKVGEVGFELLPDFQGNGLMTEALQAVLGFAFEKLQVEEVCGYAHEENQPSQRILVRNGFTKRKTIQEPFISGEGTFPMSVFYLRTQDFNI